MNIVTLTPQETAFRGATHKVIVDYNDVAGIGASAAGTLQLFPGSGDTVPIGTKVSCLGYDLEDSTGFDFSDAGITSLLVKIGDGTDDDRFLADTEIAEDGTEIEHAASAVTTQPYTYVAADTIDATFTSANGGSPLLSECTSGKMHIYFNIVDQTALTKATK